MDPLIEEEQMPAGSNMINPVSFGYLRGVPDGDVPDVLQLLASYGWFIVGGVAATMYLLHKLRPTLARWQQAREDAEYHKNPDVALARMEAIQRAREKQQQELLAASQRALQQQKEREERKRAEAAERLQKYGTAAGRRLGERDDDYLPLSGGASTSSYRPPKKSKCGGGGCGR